VVQEWFERQRIEIVFVSSDKSEDQFDEYFSEQPWLALDYSDRKLKNELSELFGVEGIPSVVIIDSDGSVISKEGRGAIAGDPTGENFPWYPKPVSNLKSGPGSIQEVPTVIAFCEGMDAEDSKKVEDMMSPLGAKFLAEAKAAGEEEPVMAFAIITEAGGIGAKVRSLMGLPETPPKSAQLMILDIPDQGGYYQGPSEGITEAVVAKLVEDYKAKTLERKQLQG